MATPYPLQPLLNVRHFRENGARNALMTAEGVLRDAVQAAEDRRAELERYRAWRPGEEERRYDAIMGTSMAMQDLDRFKAGLAALAQAELQREQAVADADRRVEECRKAVADARAAVAKARREVAKIAAHKDIWSEDMRREAERLADIEMEEFKAVPVTTSDDDDGMA